MEAVADFERCVALLRGGDPAGATTALLSLIGKKLGGFRCIATLPSWYRLLMRAVSSDFRSFDQRIKLSGDTAVKGSWAEFEVFKRGIWWESHTSLGTVSLTLIYRKL